MRIADLQKVEVKLDDDTVRKFYPTEISIYQENSISSSNKAKGNKAKIIDFCSKPTIQTLAIADIRRNGGTQQRTGLNHETVINYAELMRDGVIFPPVKVKFDGENYWLYDGFHTTEAAWSIGKQEHDAEITQGTQRDAILLSFGVNADHGLPRSNADKRNAVNNMLDDEEWSSWSNREIAKYCAVTEGLVRKIKKERENAKRLANLDIEPAQIVYTEEVEQMNGCVQYAPEQTIQGNDTDNKNELLTVEPENDYKSKDKQQALQIDSTDKTAVQPATPERKKLVENFQVDQVVKITTNAFRSDKRLVGHDTSLALVTKVNTASVDIKTWSGCFEAVSFNDLRTIDPKDVPLLCFQPTYNELQYLVANFDSREEIIKAALAKLN